MAGHLKAFAEPDELLPAGKNLRRKVMGLINAAKRML
jgi:hypothetical protein